MNKELEQKFNSMFFINQKTSLSITFLFSNPIQNIGKSFNNLKYIFDVTNSNAESIVFHIFSPNFDYNFYPDLSFIEYSIISDQNNKINLKITDFDIEKYGDMLYILNNDTNEMRLILSNEYIQTNNHKTNIYFKSDCNLNEGKFKISINFTKTYNKTKTETTQKNNIHTTSIFLKKL